MVFVGARESTKLKRQTSIEGIMGIAETESDASQDILPI